MLSHLSIIRVCHNLPFIWSLRPKGVRLVIFYRRHSNAQRHCRLHLGSAGGLEKQRTCLSSPTTDTSLPIFPSDNFILAYFPARIWTLKIIKRSQQKNATKETETKTFLTKNCNTATQIKLLVTTAILSPFKTSTKHPGDQVQPFQFWTLPFNW